MIEILTANLAAGVPQTFQINGEYLEVLDAQYPLDLQMVDRNGSFLSAMKSAEASFFSRPGKYGTVILQSANAQTVRIFIGSGDAGTRRISSTVQVVDGGRARTIAGQAFMSAGGSAAVAAQYGRVQLMNPAGSLVRLVLKSYSVAMTSAGAIACGFYSTPLATNSATKSKLSGGAAGVAQYRSETGGAQVVSPSDYVLIPANTTVLRSMQEPVVILPGAGFAMEGQINTQLNAAFEWIEEGLA